MAGRRPGSEVPTKVLYDISALGMGYAEPGWRTGVYRAVESLGISLEQSGRCDLTLVAGENFARLEQAWGYMAELGKFRARTLPAPMGSRARRPVYRKLQQVHREVSEGVEAEPDQRFTLRLQRMFLYHLDQALSQFSTRTIPAKLLEGGTIYHSPFFPIPRQVRDLKAVKKFLTVYDLNPILNPELFVAENDRYLRRLVGGIELEDFTIVISHATKRDLCEFRRDLDPERVFVTHLAAAESFYPCHDPALERVVRAKYGVPHDVPYLLSIATLSPHKNLSHLIRCFESLAEEGSVGDLHLVLAGGKGWQGEEVVRDATKSPRVRSRVIITGYVADEDLSPLYSGALAFVFPSLYEGFGLPPLEAMRCGTPVISSNSSSLPEVVGDAGILISPTDVDGLCDAVLRVYQSAELRADLGTRSMARASHFSWEKCADETLNAYTAASAL
ncbi:MAG: glycosyltransferase [Akkermansiaceae bacterium]|nr:glycosyltransferase [Akkermansiaceae bacterium]